MPFYCEDDEKQRQLLSSSLNAQVSKHYVRRSQTLPALTHISIYMGPKKLKLLMNVFAISQFGYGSLKGVFHDRNLNNKVNKMQESGGRIAYKDNAFSFENLLEMDNLVTVNQMNLQLLMTRFTKQNVV